MARKKVSTTIYLDVAQVDALKALNERTKVPMSEFIREGLDLVLAKYDATPKKAEHDEPA